MPYILRKMPPVDPKIREDKLTACLGLAATSILSVGSGDGSQKLAFVREGHPNLCATFYDSREEVIRKYPQSASILKELTEKCMHPPVFHVDATKLHEYKDTLSRFDLIFFTFPHTGIPNSDGCSAPSNQALLRGFLKTAPYLLKPKGQVQLTLKSSEYYSQWNLPKIIAEVTCLKYGDRSELRKDMFPGYRHRLTKGMQGNLKEVPDKSGATVHHFEQTFSNSATEEGRSFLTCLGIIAMHSPDKDECPKRKTAKEPLKECSCLSDDSIREVVLSFLRDTQTDKPTVLELRRQAFTNPVVPVPQLNRVLYRLKDEKLLQQLPCQGTSKKPRWILDEEA
jgi:hypothetical protein